MPIAINVGMLRRWRDKNNLGQQIHKLVTNTTILDREFKIPVNPSLITEKMWLKQWKLTTNFQNFMIRNPRAPHLKKKNPNIHLKKDRIFPYFAQFSWKPNRIQKMDEDHNNLWSFHWVMLRKINLELVHFVSVQRSWCPVDFDNPPSNHPQKKISKQN